MTIGVEFGSRTIPIKDQHVKLQIWDTVRCIGVVYKYIGRTGVVQINYTQLLQGVDRGTPSI